MIQITPKIRGEKQLYRNMDIYLRNMDIGVKAAMENVIELIVQKAQTLAPVETGKLRSSIAGMVQKMTGDLIGGHVEATAAYANYIEFGTYKTKAQPFLTPAIEEGMGILSKELERAHKRAAGRLSSL